LVIVALLYTKTVNGIQLKKFHWLICRVALFGGLGWVRP
jgi:hypothetical protein